MQDELLQRAARAIEPPAPPASTRPQDDPRRDVQVVATEGRAGVKGADADFDRAVDALAALAADVDRSAGNLAAMVREGGTPADPTRIERLVEAVKRDATATLKARQNAATKELAAAQERAYAALLPEVGPGEQGPTGERKADLERAIAAAGNDVGHAFERAWNRYARQGDRLALRLLAGDFGRDLWAIRGGDPAAFDGVRDALREAWARSDGMKDNPIVARLAKLKAHGHRASVGTASDVSMAIDRLNRALRGRA